MPESLWLDLLLRIVAWIPWGERVIRYPRFGVRARDGYLESDSSVDFDRSMWVVPGEVTNIGSAVGEECYVQLVGVFRDGEEVLGAYPIRWADQNAEEVEYRFIQPGGRQAFVMASSWRPWTRPRIGPPTWTMEVAVWPNGTGLTWDFGVGTYEVRIVVVGTNFKVRPYSYCVCLHDDGGLRVYEPAGTREAIWEWIKDPLGNKRRAKIG